MLLFDMQTIGNRIYAIRKRAALTQAEAAEQAGLSIRAYSEIERGTVNMRVETIQRICCALHITPDEILTADNPPLSVRQAELVKRLNTCPPKQLETALTLLEVYLRSLE